MAVDSTSSDSPALTRQDVYSDSVSILTQLGRLG
jgi:hypothetical protein